LSEAFSSQVASLGGSENATKRCAVLASKPSEQPVYILQLHRRSFAFRATAAEFLLQLMGPQPFRFARHQSIAGIILG
jgi:hypothetical protein